MEYVCQQCRVWRFVPDCKYEFHPKPHPDHDRWRELADKGNYPTWVGP